MTVYAYQAVRADGVRVRGQLDAASSNEAASTLAQRGLLPVSLVASPQRGVRSSVSTRDLATLFQSLSALTSAGVPLTAALAVTATAVSPRLELALADVERRVREGESLAGAMDQRRDVFPETVVGLVRAGERGTGLSHALAECSQLLERRAELVARLRAALAYPVLLAGVGSLSVAIIVLVVVPRFAVMLGDAQATLPATTRALLSLSRFAAAGGWITLLLVPGLLGLAFVAAHRHPARWHAWLLRVPLVGPLRHALATARSAATLGTLLGAGAPALAALRISQDTVADHEIAERLRRAQTRIAQGAGFGAAIQSERAFTTLGTRLTLIGDHAGRLPDMLRQAARIEEQHVESRLRALGAMLEPAIVIVFALIVAFVAAALLQAVYSLRPA